MKLNRLAFGGRLAGLLNDEKGLPILHGLTVF